MGYIEDLQNIFYSRITVFVDYFTTTSDNSKCYSNKFILENTPK